MNPLILIAGVFLFVSGILLGRQSQTPSSKILSFMQEAPSVTPSPSSTPEVSLTPTETPKETSPQPTIKPSITPKPTDKPSSSSTNLSDFKYPNSSVNTDSSDRLVLSSNDSPATITSWYESRIKELGYSSRASAKTNTNGNVTNKLGGGKNNSSVNIEITKKSSEASTTITVTTGTDSGSDVHIRIQNNDASM